MLFYHYAKERYDVLKCGRLTKHLTPEEIVKNEESKVRSNLPGGYSDHISLFIERVPEDEIAELFDHKHDFWKSGSKIHLHIVDSDSFQSDIGYMLVETPEMDEWTDKFDWENMSKAQRDVAISAMYKEMIRRGYIGHSAANLIKHCKRYLGTTKAYYEAARKRSDAEDTIKKYAANVPHVMAYPDSGTIEVKAHGIVILK